MSATPTIVRGRSCFCKHHTPTVSVGRIDGGPVCAAGVDRTAMLAADRDGLVRRLPCVVPVSVTMGRGRWEPLPCVHADYPSPDDVAAEAARDKRSDELRARGLSDCCEAAIDERAVITAGRNKGHGPRFCSACKRCLYMV